MHRVPAAVAALTTALVAVGPAAAADTSSDVDYAFPDTCDADAILAGTAECVDGVIDIDMHDDGSVTWTRETAYPRAAFEAYIEEYEGWTGTLGEYLVDQLADEEGVTTSVTDDVLTVRFASELSPDDDAMLMGFALASDGDLYAAIDTANVSDVSLVTLTAPGTIEETNGTVDGLTVTWDEAAIAELDELDVRALTSDNSSGSSVLPPWLVAAGALLLIVLAAAAYLGFFRRPAPPSED